jgi:hypothetical protein
LIEVVLCFIQEWASLNNFAHFPMLSDTVAKSSYQIQSPISVIIHWLHAPFRFPHPIASDCGLISVHYKTLATETKWFAYLRKIRHIEKFQQN